MPRKRPVVIGTIVASLFAAIVGCAASGDDAGDVSDDGSDSGASTTRRDDASDRPVFEASIDPSNDGGTTDPDADAGPTMPGECTDKDDPGGSENVAKQLTNQEDCDNSVKTVSGVLNGPVDIDYYKLTITDKAGCSVDTDFESPTAGVELCVFVKCTNGTTTTINGCAGGTQKTSEIGMKGCCANAPSKPTPDWDCEGFLDNDSADMFIRVKQNGNKCLPYTFKYRF